VKKYVLIDIDHTLSDAAWRDNLIGGEGGWDAYHEASVDDKPATDVIALLTALNYIGFVSVGITARPAKWRQLTYQYLLKHEIILDFLLMRPDDAYHPAPDIKEKLAQEFFEPHGGLKGNVLFIIDDRDDVVARFKALGITALQAHIRRH
jgi:hypothetical protein